MKYSHLLWKRNPPFFKRSNCWQNNVEVPVRMQKLAISAKNSRIRSPRRVLRFFSATNTKALCSHLWKRLPFFLIFPFSAAMPILFLNVLPAQCSVHVEYIFGLSLPLLRKRLHANDEIWCFESIGFSSCCASVFSRGQGQLKLSTVALSVVLGLTCFLGLDWQILWPACWPN